MSVEEGRPPVPGGREGLSARIIPFPSPPAAADAARVPLERLELLEQELSSLRRQFARTLEALASAPPRPWDEEFVRRLTPQVDAAFRGLLLLTSIFTGSA